MFAYYNPLDVACKSVTGAVKINTELRLNVQTDSSVCTFVLKKDDENGVQFYPMVKDGTNFKLVLKLNKTGLYFYKFQLDNGLYVGLDYYFNGVITDSPQDFQLTVYSEDYKTPDWLKGGVIYQIFPDRFYKAGNIELTDQRKWVHSDWSELPEYLPYNGIVLNNDFFGGNFNGINEKLGYLKSLGVTAIYLNPIFKAFSNHRYDTGDYFKFDELLGSEEDFKNLIKNAQKVGIKLILDGVFNHTGSDSVYFNKYGRYDSLGAYQSKQSPYYDWYSFINYPTLYEAWWGIDTLPAINDNSKSFIEFLTGKDGVLQHYVKMGIGGWRFDVIDEIPPDIVDKIRESVKSVNKDAIMIGEVWEDATNKIAYDRRCRYFQGKELDGIMNYMLKNAIINYVMTNNTAYLVHTINEELDHYPKDALDVNMNILGTHDTYRILTTLTGIDTSEMSKEQMAKYSFSNEATKEAISKLKIAACLQYTLFGVPSLYYGDEAGMHGFKDPLNRKTFPWDSINEELYTWYKKLGEIRSKIDLFKQGMYKEIFRTDDTLVFERTDGVRSIYIGVNRNSDITYQLKFKGKMYNLLTGEEKDGLIDIPKMCCGIFYTEKI